MTEIIGKKKGCIFCKMLKERKDASNYIFRRSKYSFAVLNLYPYNNGHVLVLPNRHVNNLYKLNRQEREDLMDLLISTQALLESTLKPGGYNIGINLGRVAGAGFPGHLHIHMLPRWKGDVNFMPVIGNVKVISQALKTLYERIICKQKELAKRNYQIGKKD